MRIGFIGGHGHHYLRGALNDADPVTVAVGGDDCDNAAAAAFAEQLRKTFPQNAITFFENGVDLLDQFKPELVSVGAVYGRLGDWNTRTLERNIPTVTDKPAASTWAQLDRLTELAADASRVLLTEFDFRARQTFRAARACVQSGGIGDVVLATAQKSYRFGTRPPWYADRALYPGLLMWIASHGIDAVEFVTGRRIRRGIGHGGNLSQPAYGTMDDHVAVLTVLDGGATAVIHADYGRPKAAATHGDDRLRVVGSGGVLEIRDDRCWLTTAAVPEADITDTVDPLPMHRALRDAARGKLSDAFSTRATLHTAALLLRLREAVDRQTWVEIDQEIP